MRRCERCDFHHLCARLSCRPLRQRALVDCDRGGHQRAIANRAAHADASASSCREMLQEITVCPRAKGASSAVADGLARMCEPCNVRLCATRCEADRPNRHPNPRWSSAAQGEICIDPQCKSKSCRRENTMGECVGPHGTLHTLLPKLFAFARVMLSDAETARDVAQPIAIAVGPRPQRYGIWRISRQSFVLARNQGRFAKRELHPCSDTYKQRRALAPHRQQP